MDQTLIETEFIKRRYVCDAIKTYICANFEFFPTSKLRRGAVQKEISNVLGIGINNVMCALISECMEQMGYKRGEIRGNFYYKNVKRINK